jgi:hypothetical protein
MRFPRMTTRRWMVVVAIVGLLLAAFVMVRRSFEYRRIARAHLDMYAKLYEWNPPGDRRRWAAWQRRRATYHLGLHLKYLAATRHPWLPVEPDPPEPAQ